MRGLIAALGCILSAASPTFAADILGHYDVQGKSPSGSSYLGTVDVSRTGDQTYEVVWMIGDKKSVGTGIGADGFLAIAYKNKDSYGVSAYVAKDENAVHGVWTYAGGKTTGAETWSRAAQTLAKSPHVAKALTFVGDGNGSTPPQTVFKPDVPKIALVLGLRDVRPGDTLKAVWIAEKTDGAPLNYPIDTSTLTLGESTTVAFTLGKPNAGFPLGQYRVEVSYGTGPVELSQSFAVKE